MEILRRALDVPLAVPVTTASFRFRYFFRDGLNFLGKAAVGRKIEAEATAILMLPILKMQHPFGAHHSSV
jgi:hypothetical protein